MIVLVLLFCFYLGVQSTCSIGSNGEWDVQLFSGTDCTGTKEEFWGDILDTGCYNIASNLNDKVHSFSAKPGVYYVQFYQDANCQGNSLGYSKTNWIDNSVSTAGQQMSSFHIG
jgi:hypothetical protein